MFKVLQSQWNRNNFFGRSSNYLFRLHSSGAEKVSFWLVVYFVAEPSNFSPAPAPDFFSG